MEHSVLNGMSPSNPSLRAQGTIWKKRQKAYIKAKKLEDTKKTVSSRYKTDPCMNSQRLWQHAQGLHRLKSEWILPVAMSKEQQMATDFKVPAHQETLS